METNDEIDWKTENDGWWEAQQDWVDELWEGGEEAECIGDPGNCQG